MGYDNTDDKFTYKTLREAMDEMKEENIIDKYKGSLPKVGTFMWAVEQMKAGKKVRRPYFAKDFYWEIIKSDYKNTKIFNSFGEKIEYSLEMIEANDWEIYEEPRITLWDKGEDSDLIEECYFNESDVKEALKEFLERINNHYTSPNQREVIEEAKEIFGEELLR